MTNFDSNNQMVVQRAELAHTKIDIHGRDIIIGFNEPSFKMSHKNSADIDSKLNARLITYFLPSVQIARMQSKRPRLILVSGLNVALKWNANSEEEKKIMTINNNLKFDFLRCFFEKFFPETFSIIECVVAQDPIRISEEKLLHLWQIIEKKYPEEIYEIKFQLARFKKPKLFNQTNLNNEAKEYFSSNDSDLLNSFKYAISHLLALADISFEGNFIHNPVGYLSIGGYQEKTFNVIRIFAYEILKDMGENFFGKKVILKNNLKLIIENEEKTPPPYNGYYRKNGDRLFLDEVTYENNESLDFYDSHRKLKFDMEYMYLNFVQKIEYTEFWNQYKERYFELKDRYCEAFKVRNDF